MDKDYCYFYRCDVRFETSYGAFVSETLEAPELSTILDCLETLNELYSVIDASIICKEFSTCPAENM